MGFLDLFKKKKTGLQLSAEQWQERERLRQENRELDETRKNFDLKILVAKKEVELLAIERDKLDIQADIDAEFGQQQQGESLEEKAIQFFTSIQGAKTAAAQAPHQPNTQTTSSAAADIPVETLQKTWDSVPANFKKIAQEMPDDKLKEFLKTKNPQMTEKSLSDAVLIVRKSQS